MPDNLSIGTKDFIHPPDGLDRRWQPPASSETMRDLLVFRLSERVAAFPLENVARITPMAQLARPPGLPSPLEGFLNLAGAAVPVLRLDRLLQLPECAPRLYSMLIVLKGVGAVPVAVLVDRVDQVLSVARVDLLPVSQQDSFNGCCEATLSNQDQTIHVLTPTRILLEKEHEALEKFQQIEQSRLKDWEPR